MPSRNVPVDILMCRAEMYQNVSLVVFGKILDTVCLDVDWVIFGGVVAECLVTYDNIRHSLCLFCPVPATPRLTWESSTWPSGTIDFPIFNKTVTSQEQRYLKNNFRSHFLHAEY